MTSSRRTSRAARAVGIGGLAALLVATTGQLGVSPAAASTLSHTAVAGHDRAASMRALVKGLGAGKIQGGFAAKGPVTVMIQLDTPPAATAFAGARAARESAAAVAAASRAQTARVEAAQRAVESHFGAAATKATTIYRTHALYAGIAVTTDASRLAALAALPGVRSIVRIIPKKVSNAVTVPLIKAPDAWQATSGAGQGVTIGIIDTGIDYTHADFGGSGATGDYQTALANDTVAPTYPDPTKVAGGYDFAGDAYNAGSVSTPSPDPNPLGCDADGHGTHVAGTAAGYGVNSDGSTYTGSYDTSTPFSSMRIGPGVAPKATIYALKVFGCSGSTALVAEALDWAADPNGDGNLSDHLDVVNMSLGADYASPQDPDAVAADNASLAGVTVVAAAGNNGDLAETAGSPGNATRAIAVAASDDSTDVLDGLQVNAPAGLETASPQDGTQDNVFAAEQSDSYPWASSAGVSNAEVVKLGDWTQPASSGNNVDGCDPVTQDVAGKVVLLKWSDTLAPSRTCGNGTQPRSAVVSANVVTAGGIGVVLGDDATRFSSGISGSAAVPVMIVAKEATDALSALTPVASNVPTTSAVTVTMTAALHNTEKLVTPGATDQMVSFSSRGIGMDGNVKPDVAAPGSTVFSAAIGTGTQGASLSGTSMATPHVAGVAALVFGAHPTWTPEQIKAAIMNTAGQDVYSGPGHTGLVERPLRVGAGRVDAQAAVADQTLAYVSAPAPAQDKGTGAVSVSFGPVAASTTSTLTRNVHVVNTRSSGTATYDVTYQGLDVMPGATVTVSPATVSIPAGQSTDVTVTLTVVPAQLTHTVDPTYDTVVPTTAAPLVSDFRSDVSGRVVLAPTGLTDGTSLRVPVYAAPRPASTVTDPSAVVVGSGAVATGSLVQGGAGVNQGTGLATFRSTVSALELQASSPAKPVCTPPSIVTGCTAFADDASGDLRYVGVGSDAPYYTAAGLDPYSLAPAGGVTPALLSFGITAWGPWRTASDYTTYAVFTDLNGDGTDDVVTYNTRYGSTDLFVAVTQDVNTQAVYDIEPLNNADGSYDTSLFNSDSMVLPVALGALAQADGALPTTKRVRYHVEAYTIENGVAPSDVVGLVGGASTLSVDTGSPAVGALGPTGYTVADTDQPGAANALHVRLDTTKVSLDKPLGLYLIHHGNVDGARGVVVRVLRPSTTALRLSPSPVGYGAILSGTATVSPSTATGSVVFREGSRTLGSVRVVAGRAVLPMRLALGSHTVTATYSGDATYAASAARSAATVLRASAASLRTSFTRLRYGHGLAATARVSPTSAAGRVVFRDGTRTVGTVSLVRGVAVLTLPRLSVGTHYLTATYAGSTVYAPSVSARVTVVVVR